MLWEGKLYPDPDEATLAGLLGINPEHRVIIETAPGRSATNIPGVFAAGDCRKGAYAQVAAATGGPAMRSGVI